MTTPQHPVHSGFDATSTAYDVLAGIDLTGRLAVVTGGHSGLGLETTRALSGAGATVVVGARRVPDAQAAVGDLPGVETARLDLADQDSVRTFAEALLDRPVDMVINSAGVMACPETRVGPGGEAHMGVNHLGHFALVNRLRPALRPGSRVVSVSSGGHHDSDIRWDDVHFTGSYDKWLAYGQSKTANALGGVYCEDCDIAAPAPDTGETVGVRPWAADPDAAARLWTLSAAQTGVDAFALA